MSEIWLIRHGLTEANERRLYCGATDIPLSPGGVRRLEALRGAYAAPPRCRFVTSGMCRTEQTLALLFGGVPHDADPRLRETDFGAFELRGYAELRDDPAYQAWIDGDNERNIPPGGESGAQMTGRALAALADIMADGRDTVIVTHGGVIAAVMAHLFPAEGKNRYAWQPPCGHGYRLRGGVYEPVPAEDWYSNKILDKCCKKNKIKQKKQERIKQIRRDDV